MTSINIVTEDSSTREKTSEVVNVEIKMPVAVIKKAKTTPQIAVDFAKSVKRFFVDNIGSILSVFFVVGIFGYIAAMLVCLSLCQTAFMPLLIAMIVCIFVAMLVVGVLRGNY